MTILYIYITIFTIYYILLALVSLRMPKKYRDKYTSRDSNICVILYATGEAKSLNNLIKQLKNQSYPHINYSIYVILDKCENHPDVSLETDREINIIDINNIEPIGKSQAYSILAEKLSEAPNLDAYVFMDANNYVETDFLKDINFYLTKYDVFMPMVNYIGEYKDLKFWDCVRATYMRYISKFIYASRTKLGLTNLINTDAFVIKRDLLNKIGTFDFKDKTSEVNYTLQLAKEGVITAYIDELKIYRDIEAYDLRIPSLSKRFGIFWNNLTSCKNFTSVEYVFSLIVPSGIACMIIYGMLLSHSYHFPFVVSYSAILITAIVLALAFCVSLFNAKIYAKEYLYLFAYPIYSLGHVIKHFPPVRFFRNLFSKDRKKSEVEKMVTNIIVTDGTHDFPCQMELISDNGLARVKFINRNKTYMTKNNHLRMIDAIKELSQKLSDYGMSIKICQCCKYFQPVVDGTTNMVKGVCNCQFEGRVAGDIIPTLIWNTCPRFEKENVVKLF